MPTASKKKKISKEQINRLDNLYASHKQKSSRKFTRKRKTNLNTELYNDEGQKSDNNQEIVGGSSRILKLFSSIICISIIGILIHSSSPHLQNYKKNLQRKYTESISNIPSLINNIEKERAINIEKAISEITSTSDLQNPKSPQKHALDWIVHYDQRKIQYNSNHLLQRYILAVIYFSTGGVVGKDSWTVFGDLNFLSSVHECHWKHTHKKRLLGVIACDEHMYINTLLLSGCNLQGSLPSEIGHLSSLVSLTLSDNLFTGRMPVTMGYTMKSLEYLSLDSNRLTGIIPEELGTLPKIEQIMLQFNKFSGSMPESICKIRKSYLWNLWTDCRMNGIICPCCTMCCDGISSCSM